MKTPWANRNLLYCNQYNGGVGGVNLTTAIV